MALRHFDSCGDAYATADLSAQYGIATGTVGAFGRLGTQGIRDPNGLYKALFDTPTTEMFIAGASFTWRTAFVQGFLFEPMSGGSSDLRRQFYLKVKATGKLSAGDLGADSSATLSLGVVYYIQFKVFISDTVGTCEVRVRDCTNAVNLDISDLTLTGIDSKLTASQIGWDAIRITASNIDLEDLYVADGSGSYNNDFLDDTAMDALNARADSIAVGLNQGWTPSTGTDHGALVDDATPNGDTDYNSTATAEAKDTYRLETMTAIGGTRAVKANFYARKTDNSPRTIVPVLRVAGTDYEGTASDVPIGYEYLTEIFEANPASGGPWTNFAVNSMELGQRYPTPDSITKFYLTNVAAPYTPATLRGAWDQTAGAVTKALDPSTRGGGESTQIAIAETNVSTTFDVLLYRGVSGPLAAQTIGGTLNVVIGIFESVAGADMNWHLHVYVTQGDSDTPRGTLLTDYTEALGVNEWPAGASQFEALNAAQALSSLAVSDGDRLVVEIGYISREASATSRTGTLSYGTLGSGMELIDGVVAGTDTTRKSGFLQLSQALAMSAMPAVRVSQVFLEVLAPNIPTVSDPACGGTVPAATEPSSDVSLCGVTTPVIWIEIQTDAGTKVYAKGDIATDSTFKEARLLSISPISRAVSDRAGRFETASMTVVLSDWDRSLRGLAATGTLLNKRVDVYGASAAQLAAGSTKRRLAMMVIRDFTPEPDLKFTLNLEDYLGSVLGEFGTPKLQPERVFTPTDFPYIPPTLLNKAVPIAYGLLSDESMGSGAIGVMPAIFVGPRRLTDGVDWDEYVLCGHAVKSIVSWFASNLLDVAVTNPASLGHGPRPTRMDPSSEGVEFLIPGRANYTAIVGSDTFRDFNGRRYTVIYARGQRSLDARSGDCPISVNLGGIEDTGNGTGTLICSLPRQLQHFISNFVLQSYTNGNWAAIPTVNSYSRINTASFAAVKATTVTRIGGEGYLGAWLLGWDGSQQQTLDVLRQVCQDGDMNLTTDRHGRIAATMVNSATAAMAINDVTDIDAASFRVKRRFELLANNIKLWYKRNFILDTRPDSARTGYEWWSDQQFTTINTTDATSVTNHAETRTLAIDAWSLRDSATAADVAAKLLARLKDGPIYADFRVIDLCATDLELGDNLTATDFAGMSSTGWTDKLLRAERITFNPDDLTVDIEGQAI